LAKHGATKDDSFGKGEIKGIAAVESAKSACTSGALIPLLSLGIPGDAVTAILIGAFILHGIQPGPLLFENHAPLTAVIFTTVVFAHLLVFAVAMLSVKWSTLVLKIDERFIKASVLILAIVGSYALRNNITDVYIAFAFGVIGVIMQRGQFPVAPFLLALILGQMAEVNFRRALMLADGSFNFLFEAPIALGILLVAITFFVLALVKRFRKNS
jgi:putative tricarboxylic transport membrane protein